MSNKGKTAKADKATPQGRVPKLRFPEFRDEGAWEEKLLGEVGKFTGGGTPIKKNDSYWCGKKPWCFPF